MDAPDGLHERGAALWGTLSASLDLSGAAGLLALEACRCADRLDELDSIIAGKGVLKLMQFRVGDVFHTRDDEQRVNVSVKFDSVLAEARQQQMALRQLLITLGVEKPSAHAKGRSTFDDLAARRRDRKPKAAGQ